MNDFQNNYLSEAVRQKIKLFTKEPYFPCFNHILIEKSKNFVFKKIFSFSNEFLQREKEKIKNNQKLIKVEKEKSSKSFWHLIMFLIIGNPNKKIIEYKKNEFNLNPICYAYISNLCKKKLKLLSSFSIANKISLDILVKFYLDLCINQINQKESDNNTKQSMILDYKKLTKKGGSMKKFNLQKNNINISVEKKKSSMLGPAQLEYSNSFTRLFIGEVDPISIKERYLSNIVVKKMKQLHLYSSYQELSNMYLKRLYKKLFKKENKGIIDFDMADILSKFKYDTKKVENYQRNALSFEKKNIRDDYIDEEKQNLEMQLQKQKSLYMEKKNEKNSYKKRKNYKLLSLSPRIIRSGKDFKLKKKNNFIIRYKNINSSFINSSNSKSQYLSFNMPSNRKRYLSAKSSTNELNYNLDNYNNINFKKYDSIFSNDIKHKKEVIRKSSAIFKIMKKTLDKKNNKYYQKRKINLKNYMKNEDFFFSKMN